MKPLPQKWKWNLYLKKSDRLQCKVCICTWDESGRRESKIKKKKRERGSLSIVKGVGEGGGSKRQRRVRWESYRLIRRENHGSNSRSHWVKNSECRRKAWAFKLLLKNIIFQVFYKDLNHKNWSLLLTSPSGPCRFDIFGELPPDIPWGLISRHDKLCSAWTDSFSGSHFFRTLPDYLGKMAGSRRKPWVSEAVFVVLLVPHISYLSPCQLSSYDTHKKKSVNK